MNYKDLLKDYHDLHVEGYIIGLEEAGIISDYFCAPVGNYVIGWDNGIHYAFIEGYGETVFCINPEPLDDRYVYPIARSFKEFLSLILSTGCTNPLFQIVNMTKEEFKAFNEEKDNKEYANSPEVINELNKIKKLGLVSISDPYDYVMDLQNQYDLSNLVYSNDYYDTLGLERPDGSENDFYDEVEIKSCFGFIKRDEE